MLFRSAGLDAEDLDGGSCRRIEPFLGAGVSGGLRCAGGWRAGSRRYVAALREVVRAVVVRVVRGPVIGVRADGQVIVGAASEERGYKRPAGSLIATGHCRNGILLSAVTAGAAVACLAGQPPPAKWRPFSPQRFTVGAGPR